MPDDEFYPDPGTFRLFLDPSVEFDQAFTDAVFELGQGDLLPVRQAAVCSIVGDLPDNATAGERREIADRLKQQFRQRGVNVVAWFVSYVNRDGSLPTTHWRFYWRAFLRGFGQPFASVARLARRRSTPT